MLSKLSAADLLYVGKGHRHMERYIPMGHPTKADNTISSIIFPHSSRSRTIYRHPPISMKICVLLGFYAVFFQHDFSYIIATQQFTFS